MKDFLNSKVFTLYLFQGIGIVLGLAIGKIIATYFPASVFGEYNLITGGIALITSIFFTPLIYAFRFKYNDHKHDDIQLFYKSVIIWLVIFIALLIAIYALLFGLYSPLIILFICILLLSQYLQDFNIAILNLDARHNSYSFISLINNVSWLIALAVFAWAKLTNEIQYLLIAGACAPLVGFIFSTTKMQQRATFTLYTLNRVIRHAHFRPYLKFVAPLILLPIFSWLINQGDKFLIAHFYSKQEVGLYAAPYGLGSKLFLSLNGPLVLFLNPKIYNLSETEKQEYSLFVLIRNLMLKYLLLGSVIIGVVAVLKDWIGQILLSEQYSASFGLIPLTCFAYLLVTTMFFMEQVFYARGQTRILLASYIISALSNLGLNLYLIPAHGIYGAGISMIISSFIQLCVEYYFLRNLFSASKPT